MAKVLILFAHPRLETSRIHNALLHQLPKNPDLYFNDLYEQYPNFNIDIEREKNLLQQHDIIIWQHPLYWYSSPPLIKQWIDMVLEFGWAYGPGGNTLTGKMAFNVISSGGPEESYSATGHHKNTLRQFLLPFERTTTLCNMRYLPPFAIHGTHRLNNDSLLEKSIEYKTVLNKFLFNDFDMQEVEKLELMNDIAKPVNQ